MKSVIRNSFWFVIAVGLAAGLSSCSDMDEYKKYVEEGEVSYTGKIDSLSVYSGHNRVMVEGLFTADPKINEARIFWNNGVDSAVVPVNRTAGIDTMQHIIDGLQEKVYNFEVITYDSLGNSSLPVNANARVYGERYQNSLNNRPVVKKEVYAGNLEATVQYGSMDLTSGVFATEIKYSDVDGDSYSMMLPIEETQVMLENFKIGSAFEYRTMFLPEPTSIDTFYTEFEAATPDVQYLKNYEAPFATSERGDRWGTLAEWTTNDAIKNHGGYGGFDASKGDMFNVESGWGSPGITNGKVYQTITLSPGTYTFSGNITGTSFDGNGDQAYLVAAEGNTLPNVDGGAIETDDATIEYVRLMGAQEHSIEFEINQQMQVSVGFATTQGDGGEYCIIDLFEFYKNE